MVIICWLDFAEKRNIYVDSQHPEGWAKIRDLESFVRPTKAPVEEPESTPPKFVSSLVGTTQVYEGERAHFECRVEPIRDSSLRVEWYHNGKPLPQGNRFHTTHDFGYVALDISHCVPEDAGEYTAKAINSLGEAVNSISMKVISKGSIITDSQRPEGLDKIRALEEPKTKQIIDEVPTFQRPVFTVPLQNLDDLAEMDNAHFEGRLIPVNDPKLKVEWFRNEKPLEESSRIKRTHDFGFVALDISKIRPEDEGVYMCRASNELGEAVTTASMRIKGKFFPLSIM